MTKDSKLLHDQSKMKYSIVIPTYNEENDIYQTLENCSRLLGDFEVLVVDDSTDSTPKIVEDFPDDRIHLIRPTGVAGRCEARNRGILLATGDVVVILNADVHLPSDFLERLDLHYSQGAECVLVKSVISNQQDLFARFVECRSLAEGYLSDTNSMDWTEGYSVLRSIAIASGLFPVGFPVPICAGEDGYFGTNVRSLVSHRVVDLSITVTHIAPADVSEYWNIRKGRGKGSAQVRRYLNGWSYTRLLIRESAVLGLDILSLLLIIPLFFRSARASKYSEDPFIDVFRFAWALVIERAAFHTGFIKECLLMRIAEEKLG